MVSVGRTGQCQAQSCRSDYVSTIVHTTAGLLILTRVTERATEATCSHLTLSSRVDQVKLTDSTSTFPRWIMAFVVSRKAAVRRDNRRNLYQLMEDTSHDLSPRDSGITHSCSQTAAALKLNHPKHALQVLASSTVATFSCVRHGSTYVMQQTTQKAWTSGCTSMSITETRMLAWETIPGPQSET